MKDLDTKFLREVGHEAAVAVELDGETVSEVAVAVLKGDIVAKSSFFFLFFFIFVLLTPSLFAASPIVNFT